MSARSGLALPAAAFLVVLMASGAVLSSAFRDDVSKQAARLESRGALSSMLASAATEAWWTIGHPGLIPSGARAEEASRLLTRFGEAEFAPEGATETLGLPLTRDLVRMLPGLTVEPAEVRIRQWQAGGPVPQGLVEVRVRGRLDGVKLALVELRRVWIVTVPGASRPYVELAGVLAARRVEGM